MIFIYQKSPSRSYVFTSESHCKHLKNFNLALLLINHGVPFLSFPFLVISQVAGGCWYVLAIHRVASCLREQCKSCNRSLSCSEEVCYQYLLPESTSENPCGGNFTIGIKQPLCLDAEGPFNYGIYQWALPVVSSNSLSVKILYPIFWGFLALR